MTLCVCVCVCVCARARVCFGRMSALAQAAEKRCGALDDELERARDALELCRLEKEEAELLLDEAREKRPTAVLEIRKRVVETSLEAVSRARTGPPLCPSRLENTLDRFSHGRLLETLTLDELCVSFTKKLK